MARHIEVMVAAIVLAMAVMLWASAPVTDFVNRHPTIKMLALSFLILIGTMLTAEGIGFDIPKGYIYFAMAFSVGVEMLNLRLRKRAGRPVELRDRYTPGDR
jgi:predicted tellurium resistance membrane protein TerC